MGELFESLHIFWVAELISWNILEVDEKLDKEVVRRLIELGDEEEVDDDEA